MEGEEQKEVRIENQPSEENNQASSTNDVPPDSSDAAPGAPALGPGSGPARGKMNDAEKRRIRRDKNNTKRENYGVRLREKFEQSEENKTCLCNLESGEPCTKDKRPGTWCQTVHDKIKQELNQELKNEQKELEEKHVLGLGSGSRAGENNKKRLEKEKDEKRQKKTQLTPEQIENRNNRKERKQRRKELTPEEIEERKKRNEENRKCICNLDNGQVCNEKTPNRWCKTVDEKIKLERKNLREERKKQRQEYGERLKGDQKDLEKRKEANRKKKEKKKQARKDLSPEEIEERNKRIEENRKCTCNLEYGQACNEKTPNRWCKTVDEKVRLERKNQREERKKQREEKKKE